MICTNCFQTRRRSFFDAAGVCEHCPTHAGPKPLEGPVWPLGYVVTVAARYHDANPWVTDGQARDRGGKSSAQTIFERLAVEEVPASYAIADMHALCLDWAKSLGDIPEESANDYQCAVYKLYRTGWVTADTFGLACSIYHAWWKDNLSGAKLPEPKKAPAFTGRHYGQVGQKGRVNIPLCQCTFFKELGANPDHPEWGERFLIKFTAGSGEELTWFAGAGGKFDPKPGGTYNIRCTIAKHDVYDGKASTIIQRCTEFDPSTGEELPQYRRTRKKKETDDDS